MSAKALAAGNAAPDTSNRMRKQSTGRNRQGAAIAHGLLVEPRVRSCFGESVKYLPPMALKEYCQMDP